MKEPKLKTVYVCSNCGETSPRWMGRCPSCGSWNTMNEDVVAEAPKAGTAAGSSAGGGSRRYGNSGLAGRNGSADDSTGLFWCRRTAAGNSSRWCREPLQRLDRCILQKGTRPAVRACTGPVLCGIARGAQRSFRYAYGRAAAAAVCCADPVRQYWRIAGHGDPGEKAPQLNK